MKFSFALSGFALLLASAAAQIPPGPPPGNADLKGAPESGPGADPAGLLKIMLTPLPAGTPQPSADPHDLSGTWFHNQPLEFEIDPDEYGNAPPYTPLARKILARRAASQRAGKPYLNASSTCHPPGLPWQQDLNNSFGIYQSKDRFDVLFQEYHGLETIFMNPAKAPNSPSYMGHSIGHWDGDTLVVVTTGMKQPIWLDPTGTPASPQAVLTQRIRKVHQDQWMLRIENTIEDPKYFTHPWSWVRSYVWRPDKEMLAEYNCEQQIGDKDNHVNVGLEAEPEEDLK